MAGVIRDFLLRQDFCAPPSRRSMSRIIIFCHEPTTFPSLVIIHRITYSQWPHLVLFVLSIAVKFWSTRGYLVMVSTLGLINDGTPGLLNNTAYGYLEVFPSLVESQLRHCIVPIHKIVRFRSSFQLVAFSMRHAIARRNCNSSCPIPYPLLYIIYQTSTICWVMDIFVYYRLR